jgi:hypothetical protein
MECNNLFAEIDRQLNNFADISDTKAVLKVKKGLMGIQFRENIGI